MPPVALSGNDNYRVTLPDAPQDVEPCLRNAFPEIPDRDLTNVDLLWIVGEAKLLDRAKTACGLRAVAFIKAERVELARQPIPRPSPAKVSRGLGALSRDRNTGAPRPWGLR